MVNLDLWRNNTSPLRELTSFGKAFDRMFEEWPALRNDITKYNNKYEFNPTCEVHENKSAFVLKMDLPGVTKEDIKIDLHDNRLTISGERRVEKKEDDSNKEQKTYFSEVFYGAFSRSMTFPVAVNAEKTEAHYENGVLTMTIPKTVTQGTRQISIK